MKNILSYLENKNSSVKNKKAIALKDSFYSFSDLNSMSKKVGALIDPTLKNSPIGVIAERDTDTLVYFFGAVYSGNFYVPIDPDMPSEKQQAIIDDADIKIILGSEKNKAIIDRLSFSGNYYSLNNITDKECGMPDTGDDDPLYMVYTSGSTGKPKGVLKSHKAVIRYIEAYCNTFDFSQDDIIGNQTPFFFDASAKDIYLMLKTGATMEIIPTEKFAMPTELIEYMNEKKITFISWVPTALSIVAQLNTFSYIKPETLKKVFFVGEVMPMKHLNKWRAALPDLQYVNLYGQSELAGICCYYEVKGEFDNAAVLPMGKPLSNCKIYLLDNDAIVTEPDHIGEMYIVSDSLALEYYNDPEKTNTNFTIRDFGEGPVRCFKTGDLASYNADGDFVFASRTDFQIKHMGHRIELGEIEAIAGALPEIQRCCCLYNQEKKKIVLFCALSADVVKTGQEIQSILRTKLSSYMVPARVVVMEKLPLNANGKINRQLLKEQL